VVFRSNFKQLEAILRDFCFFGSFFGFGDNSKIAVACYKITVVSYGKETVHWSTEADCLWGLAMTIEGLRQQIHWYKAP
jgi:hypothetical protein